MLQRVATRAMQHRPAPLLCLRDMRRPSQISNSAQELSPNFHPSATPRRELGLNPWFFGSVISTSFPR
ncbi:hypothetical protein CSUI_002062 [Cystoisospora suis]|uniref:Uncharacterized protein n=1 Tax=Cystoisospora suis TaxID=483139 RepID=A0A2C6L9L1_9APIC|nr:hypothetical protein CSUI_002062 [Cystoisospora suis]